MAYPDYSIVIICVTEGGVTTDYAKSFFTKALAEKYYRKAVSEGKRAFLYEKPQPTKFRRNNAQKIAISTEKAAFALAVTTPSSGDTSGTTAIVKEAVHKFASFQIDTAFGILETIQTANFKIGEKVYEVYDNAFNKFRKFIGWEYNAINSVAATLTISNKQIVIKHNGSGGFLAPVITKLWPNKDEFVDEQPVPVMISIGTNNATQVQVGLKTVRKTYDGTQYGTPTQENFFMWVPAPTSLLIQDEIEYLSDGEGWYTTRDVSPDSNCDPVGTVYSLVSTTPITTNLSQHGSEYANITVVVGDEYVELVADGVCGEQEATRQEYLPHGTIVYENDTDWFKKSVGNLDTYKESKNPVDPNDPNDPQDPPADPDIDPATGCAYYGVILSTSEVDGETVIGTDNQYGEYSYIGSKKVTDTIANGNCGNFEGEERIEWTPVGTVYGERTDEIDDDGDGQTETVTLTQIADVNGGYTILRSTDERPYDPETDGDSGEEQDPTPEGGTNPPSDPCANLPECPPCPEGPAGTYRKTPAGAFVGTKVTTEHRRFDIPLPAGFRVISTRTAPASKSFITGDRWSGRQISNGCGLGWTPEIAAEDSTWSQPPNAVAKKQGTGANDGSTPSFVYKFYKFVTGPTKNPAEGTLGLANKYLYIEQQFIATHDGVGGINWKTLGSPVNRYYLS